MGFFGRNADIADAMATDAELEAAVEKRRQSQQEARAAGDREQEAKSTERLDRALDHLALRRR